MFITRNLKTDNLFHWLSKYVIWLIIYNSIVAIAYGFLHMNISLPWLPISVVGTAVAFFIGFKNNQAYDRLWEARKIWGGIVNDSRTWGMRINNLVNPEKEKKELIYRHIAWMYAHRIQLLKPTSWEQISDSGHVGMNATRFRKIYGLEDLPQNVTFDDLQQFLSQEEFNYLKTVSNPATQILNKQSAQIKRLKDEGIIDQFEHLQLEELLRSFFTLQGQNERIKKFPFPRDYSTMSRLFVYAFISLLPFSIIPELMNHGYWTIWVSVPVAVLIGMFYIIMEDIGDYNENPYMETPHATPMLSISRTIEIDLREMLKEENIPAPIDSVNGILM